MTHSWQKWVTVVSFDSGSTVAQKIIELEDYPVLGMFFEFVN